MSWIPTGGTGGAVGTRQLHGVAARAPILGRWNNYVYLRKTNNYKIRWLLQMRIIGNLREITEIIWLTKEVSRMLGNSYGITGLIGVRG